jgi:hypothetical protein
MTFEHPITKASQLSEAEDFSVCTRERQESAPHTILLPFPEHSENVLPRQDITPGQKLSLKTLGDEE